MFNINGRVFESQVLDLGREESGLLGHLIELVDDALMIDPEIRDSLIRLDTAQMAEQLIKQGGSALLEETVLALGTSGIYEIKSLLRFSIQVRNLLRPVLKVTIHHDHPLPRRIAQTGRDCMMLPKIP